jgi:uncharacterized repeat protein (TIGR03803 family)
MFRLREIASASILSGVCAVGILANLDAAHAATFRVLYTFCLFHSCADGGRPGFGSLIFDAKGNLYGTTDLGYKKHRRKLYDGGTVYKLAPDGTETVLFTFPGYGNIGDEPNSLVMDSKGNLFGTTELNGLRGSHCGIAYEITAAGSERTLHRFAGEPTDGCGPQGSLVIDANDNLFGATSGGGKHQNAGTAFKIAEDGTKTVLYNFCTKGRLCAHGASPQGGLIMDQNGTFYGTTEVGGSQLCNGGCGTVFELASDGTESVLHEFKGSPNDGWLPHSNLIEDQLGNFYGTTDEGGIVSGLCDGSGCGTVFKLAPDGDESILYYFKGGRRGFSPIAGLIEDAAGNLYGTTLYGGSAHYPCGAQGCGTVFEIAPDGTETVLYSFKDKADGAYPLAGLVADGKGNFYGTASNGGAYGYGTVFEITP